MKTLMTLFAAVLLLNTTNAISGTNEMAKQKKNVRNQINYALATADISEKGTVTIYFYVLDKKVKIQKVEGLNQTLNTQVKERLEKTGFTKKGLNGYYTITIKLNGSLTQAFSKNEKCEMCELMALNLNSLQEEGLAE
jgi:hypothetical protein